MPARPTPRVWPRALLAVLLLLSPAFAGDIPMADGTTMQGTIGRVVPAQVEIKLASGAMMIPLEKLSLAQQEKILGHPPEAAVLQKLQDLEKQQAAKSAGHDPAATHIRALQKYTAVMERLSAAQMKLIRMLETTLGRDSSHLENPPIPVLPPDIQDRIRSLAVATHPDDIEAQLTVVSNQSDSWKKLQNSPPPEAIRRQAALDFPNDYVIQLFAVEEARKALPPTP